MASTALRRKGQAFTREFVQSKGGSRRFAQNTPNPTKFDLQHGRSLLDDRAELCRTHCAFAAPYEVDGDVIGWLTKEHAQAAMRRTRPRGATCHRDPGWTEVQHSSAALVQAIIGHTDPEP